MATDIVNMLRNRTALAQQEKTEKRAFEEEEARREDVILQQEMKERAQKFFAECIERARVAADEGESQIKITVMRDGEEKNPKWCQYLTQYTRKLLHNARLKVRIEYEEEGGLFGRNPTSTHTHTVYNVYLYISWA